MKKKFFLLIVLLFCVVGLSLTTYTFIPRSNVGAIYHTIRNDNKFLLGAMDDAYDSSYTYLYDSLKFNFWHKYTTPFNGQSWKYFGVFSDDSASDPSVYSPAVLNKISINSQENLYTLMDRPRIQYACFGQRSDYQCERITEGAPYWFYAYNNSLPDTGAFKDTIDNTFNGNGAKVKRCLHTASGKDSTFIVSGLRATREQTNNYWGYVYIGDQSYDWYVMPRLRIDTSFANDTLNFDIPVCKIVISNNNGTKTKSQILKVKHFKSSKNAVYNGNYLDTFFTHENDTVKNLFISSSKDPLWFNSSSSYEADSYVDFKVFWYDKCDIWVDRIRVENNPAHRLLTLQDTSLINPLYKEIRIAKNALDLGYKMADFYIEEFEFNHMPSMKAVNKMITDSTNGYLSLMCNYQHEMFKDFKNGYRSFEFTDTEIKEYLIDYVECKSIFMVCYNLLGYPTSDDYSSKNPNTLPIYTTHTPTHSPDYDSASFLLAEAVSPQEYDKWVQYNIDSIGYKYNLATEMHGMNFIYVMKRCAAISKMADIPFYFMPQADYWNTSAFKLKEPANEEVEMMNNLAISYGAKGILYFIYGGHDLPHEVVRGLTDPNPIVGGFPIPRRTNAYKQLKFEIYKKLGNLIRKWEPYLMSFGDDETKSYVYRIEKSSMASQTFINDLKTFKTSDISDSEEEETTSNRYLQTAVFDNDSANTAYFMVVNRRCSPVVPTYPDGRRRIEIKFNANSSEFGTFNNWKVIDVENNSTVVTFDKTVSSFLNLGWFEPGQGKLYKVVPVMIDGGTFVTDESLRQIDFKCNGTVYTNGHNLTLEEGVNIRFKENTQIRMKKGEFLSGVLPSLNAGAVEQNTLKGQGSDIWDGIYFDSTDVNMGYLTIQDVNKDVSSNSGYVLNFINCDTVSVSHTYITTTDSAGCINIYYSSGGVTNPVIELTYDSLNVNIAGNPPLNMYSISTVSGNFAMENSVIKNFYSSGGGTGVLMTGFNHFSFYANYFRSFLKDIYSIHSSPDLWANVLSGGSFAGYSYNLYGESTTVFDLSSTVNGNNSITMFSGECIKLDNSYVDIHNGGNYFSVYDTLGYHLRGYFDGGHTNTNQDGRGNCFIVRDIVRDSAHARINVILGDLTPVNYRLLPFASGCNPADNSKTSEKIITEKKTDASLKNNKNSKTSSSSETVSLNFTDNNDKRTASETLYPEMKKELKQKNYSLAADKCREILALGEENMYSVDAVRKLFHCIALSQNKLTKKTNTSEKADNYRVNKSNLSKHADEKTDKVKGSVSTVTDISGMSDLKTYYESYIQSHSANKKIISEMFYYIQKCKINLGDYESALNGYKAIMEKNPNNMAGLNAKWEYSDLQLLISSISVGMGGGESGTLLSDRLSEEQKHERLVRLIEGFIEDPKDGPKDGRKDKADKKQFNKEERKTITNNIINSLEANNTSDKLKLKTLEQKVNSNNASSDEVKEYKKTSLLRELIKIEKANNIIEQISMIQNDMGRILDLDKSTDNNIGLEEPVAVAFDYKLSQNYPNPFNPSTKINFELKHNGYVSLKIYDLLGREITELVNETKDAGRYTIDFNAAKYMMASGIYFYRIKAGEFVDTKRMVLVK